MTTWHITIIFQAPRGAVITDHALDSIYEAWPEFNAVSRIAGNRLAFMVDADSDSSTDLYAEAYRRAAEASTDALGYPVEFLRGEIVDYDHFMQKLNIAHA